jgi:hypothetical protein
MLDITIKKNGKDQILPFKNIRKSLNERGSFLVLDLDSLDKL